jgi:hypothetical protein
MTEDEVKAVVPNAVKPKTPSTIEGGATELLRLEEIEVEEIPFTALFYFKEGKLLQVTLTVKDRRKFQDSLDRFEVLRSYLRKKFGNENASKSSRGLPSYEQLFWITEERMVALFLMGVTGDAVLNIVYQGPLSAEEAKSLGAD